MKLLAPVCEARTRSSEQNEARLPIRALLIAAAALLMIPGLARAADTTCLGPLDPAGSPYGNVVVPAGVTCFVNDVRVNGNVTVFGSLFVFATTTDTTIRGNVNSKDGCGQIVIAGGGVGAPEPTLAPGAGKVVVGGNVNIEHCQGGTTGGGGSTAPAVSDGSLGGPQVLIGNNLKCSNNTGSCTVLQTVVGGNVELSGNGGSVSAVASFIGNNLTANNNDGTARFIGNAIGGDLKCAGNASVLLAPNTVAGTQQGQCALP